MQETTIAKNNLGLIKLLKSLQMGGMRLNINVLFIEVEREDMKWIELAQDMIQRLDFLYDGDRNFWFHK
jgi:hypothetical protein